MALNIRNAEADILATEVARITGETKTQAVIAALQERLTRVRRARGQPQLRDELLAIARHCAACRCWTQGRQTRSWAMTSTDCRADGDRYLGTGRHPDG